MMTNSFTISPHSKEFEPSPRWVRVYFNKQLIADSKEMMLLRESDHLPLYCFPKEDVQTDCLQPSDHTAHSELKGRRRLLGRAGRRQDRQQRRFHLS